MERARLAVAVLGSIATILAGLATIFPDTFAIRGTPPLSSVLRAILGLALPLAVGCALAYLLILDRRLGHLQRDYETLAAEQERIRLDALRTPAYEDARRIMGSENHPPN